MSQLDGNFIPNPGRNVFICRDVSKFILTNINAKFLHYPKWKYKSEKRNSLALLLIKKPCL